MDSNFIMQSAPLTPLNSEVVEQFLARAMQVLMIQEPKQAFGFSLNCDRLSRLDADLLKDGDIPPIWVYWWLSLTVELKQEKYGCVSIIYPISKNKNLLSQFPISLANTHNMMTELTVKEICTAISSDMWLSSWNMYIIAWGISNAAGSKTQFPVVCRGAVIMILDALGCLFITTNESDRVAFQEWINV
jgi:hypothetical protein